MILYHGSNVEILQVDLLKCKPNKDFGRAFYLSESREQALELAQAKVDSLKQGNPIVTAFEIDDGLLDGDSLKVLRFSHYDSAWADFIFSNRNGDTASHGYDIVYGPIANDKVGLQIFNLRRNYISREVFLERLKYMKGETFQYALCTEAAISKLHRV